MYLGILFIDIFFYKINDLIVCLIVINLCFSFLVLII